MRRPGSSSGASTTTATTTRLWLENPRTVVPNSDKAAWVDAWCGSLMNMWNRDFVRANYPAQIDDLVDRSPDGTVAVGKPRTMGGSLWSGTAATSAGPLCGPRKWVTRRH